MKKILKLTAVILVVAAVLFAAGCGEKAETPANESQENPNMAGETPDENAMTENNASENSGQTGKVVTEEDSDTTISLKTGENFTLNLTENPSTGYAWQVNVTDGLKVVNDTYIEDPNPEQVVGIAGTHSWIIEAITPGTQQVNGIYKRNWENTTGTEDTFNLTVDVV